MKNNKIKKAVACVMGMTMLASTGIMAGCNLTPPPGAEDFYESVDTSKTQLYVGNFNGGLGFEWIMKAKARFEAENPDVQIMIDNGKDEYAPSSLMTNMKTNRQDMYVVDGSDYYQYVANGLLADITDVVTEGGELSIENRMSETLRNFFKTADGKYYAVPFYQTFYHLTYDVDLFDAELLWLNEDGTGFVESLDEPRYAGPEGGGTWDDGLPYTYSQFFMLLDKMCEKGIKPITATGKFKDTYYPKFLNTLFADYAGETFMSNLSLEGEVKVLTSNSFTEPEANSFSLDSSYYGTKTLTNDNKADHEEILAEQAGKYYALKFAKDLLGKNYKYVNQAKFNSPAETHTMAQDTFVRSSYLNKPIGMLIEGGWWYNEAKVSMESMADEYGDEWHWSERRFGVMPLPKADDGSSATGRTVASDAGSAIFISNFTEKKDLAKKFFKFIHTDESLKEFTATTLVNRPYDYEMDSEYLSSVPYYTKNMNEALSDINVMSLVPQKTELAYNASKITGGIFNSIVGNNSFANPLVNFFEERNLTALDYYKGLKTYAGNVNFWGK